MGFPIFNFTHPADQSKIRKALQKIDPESNRQHSTSKDQSEYNPDVNECSRSSTPHVLAPYVATTPERGPRQSFYIRLREKPLAKQDPPQYEHMHVVGHLRRQVDTVNHSTFVGVMRPVRDRPITELSLVESSQDQYITRHTPDGRIVYTDHRISTIAGYLPSEVRGKSAFNFFFAEDLPWTTMAMRHMFASSNGEGSTVYRLFTQTGELICLETRGFLEFNKTTNKIESFLCINTLIRPEDSERYLNEQKERFTPFISQLQVNNMGGGISLETSSSSSLLSLSMLPSPVSVISKPAINGSYSTSPPSITSPGSRNHLKRSFADDSHSQQEEYTVKERLESKILKYEGSKKRKLEDDGEEQQQRKRNNWQYTARTEPVHRTEDGMRVVEIEDQFSRPEQSFYNNHEGKIELQHLMNEMNKSLQESSNSSSTSLNQNTGSDILTEKGLSQTKFQTTSSGTSAPARVCSVIRMLPHRQTVDQKEASGYEDQSMEAAFQPTSNHLPRDTNIRSSPTNQVPSTINHLPNTTARLPSPTNNQPSGNSHTTSTINPLDNDRTLADFLPQPTFNHPINNSITREFDLIKQELINSSCSEAERIAEKLKLMLAPLSDQHNRNNIHREIKSPQPLEQSPLTQATHPGNSDLLEILNQDLVFSLEEAHSEENQLSLFKDEVPATSS